MKNNMFKYLSSKYVEISKTDKFQEVKEYSFDFLFTALSIGMSLFLLKQGNSFAKGIGFAIILALMQGYVKWFADIVKDIKRSK